MTIDGAKRPQIHHGRSHPCGRQSRKYDDPGFCICCGADALGVEPDARRYECESCGESGVYGAEELLLSI